MENRWLITEINDGVCRVQINRPEALNALNTELIRAIADTLETCDRNEETRCMILTGIDQAFAAGADINEMKSLSPSDFLHSHFFKDWERIRRIKKPIVAQVSGFVLGGGCELAMICDCIIASETAVFGQPEIRLGVMPGAGGTQRLTRALGKSKAMEMILTGRTITAQEAASTGLISRVVLADELEGEVRSLARSIAAHAPLAVQLAKQSVLNAAEVGFAEGLLLEQNSFYLLFSTNDQDEGFEAFLEKRKPQFHGN
ncbi:enoyl-CoA hydratase-related protein [Baia soyae]|nr:enoyl-CoA hydratase-related protein [Baia soyae]